MREDVECSRRVNFKDTEWQCRYHGRTYFFCSLSCKERFDLEPEDYFPEASDAFPLVWS